METGFNLLLPVVYVLEKMTELIQFLIALLCCLVFALIPTAALQNLNGKPEHFPCSDGGGLYEFLANIVLGEEIVRVESNCILRNLIFNTSVDLVDSCICFNGMVWSTFMKELSKVHLKNEKILKSCKPLLHIDKISCSCQQHSLRLQKNILVSSNF